jgi:hypothetical protein
MVNQFMFEQISMQELVNQIALFGSVIVCLEYICVTVPYLVNTLGEPGLYFSLISRYFDKLCLLPWIFEIINHDTFKLFIFNYSLMWVYILIVKCLC